MIRPPQPRYRLYTRPAHYATLAAGLLRGWRREDEADCRRLEAALTQRLASPHARCVPQDRVGIYLAVRALVRPGRQVVLSPYTLTDVVNMVVCAGAEPVFADIDPVTCNLDPAAAEALIGPATDAVLVTHLHGLAADLPRFREICDRHGLALIEDAAQAFGAALDGRAVGSVGDAGVFSFGLYKNVNSFYGGALVTPRAEVAERVDALMADWPRQPPGPVLRKAASGLAADLATWPPLFKALTFWVFRYAYLHDIEALNRTVRIELAPALKTAIPEAYRVRMSPTQARLVLGQLADVDAHSRARIRAAERYDAGLAGLDLGRPPLHADGRHIYTHYPVQAADREALIRHMVAAGRDVAIQHLRNCAELDCFARWRRDCPNAAAVARQTILLSTYPRFGPDQVERTVAAVRGFFGKA